MVGADCFNEAYCYLGMPQTGKSLSLIKRAYELAQQDSGNDALLVCATAEQVAFMQSQVQDAGVRCLHINDLALEIMSEPVAYELYGRAPRILDPFEEQFLFEDLRVTTFKGRRLHQVFDFLESGWSRLADDDETWLISLEEERIQELVRDNLALSGGILLSELANFAVNVLRKDDKLKSKLSVKHVLVDDYHVLNRASQLLTQMLAKDTFTFSADDTMPINPMYRGYPYQKGIQEFLDDYANTSVVRLEKSSQPAPIKRVLTAISDTALTFNKKKDVVEPVHDSAHADLLEDSSAVSIERADTMSDELKTIALHCMQALKAGESVKLVGASKLWLRSVCSNFEKIHLPVKRTQGPIKLKDFRDEKAYARAYKQTLARLKENPHDGVAWRSMIGFGDYVARSAALEDIREVALEQHMGIEEALDALSKGQLEGFDPEDTLYKPLVSAYHHTREVIASFANDKDETVKQEQDYPAVIVTDLKNITSSDADVVIVGGFVNGMIPSSKTLEKQNSQSEAGKIEWIAELQSLYAEIAGAHKRVIFTGFKTCSLEAAERLGVKIGKIKLQDGVRICHTEPSFYAQKFFDESLI